MTKALEKLLGDAKAAGYTVRVDGAGNIDIFKSTVTGRIVQGLVLYPDGTAFDATVDLSVTKGIRSYKEMRMVLGLDQ